MALSDKIKPISYLKANAAKISLELTESEGPMYITQNGEAKMVVQDVKSLGNQQIKSGNIQAADSAFDNLKQELNDR